jgi:hypothetical protein
MKQPKYVLLLISHPRYKPTNTEVNDFVHEKLPELHKGEAQIASYNISGAITLVVIRNIAIDVFGEEVANQSLYTYRTISFSISGGEGGIFAVYRKQKLIRRIKFWFL